MYNSELKIMVPKRTSERTPQRTTREPKLHRNLQLYVHLNVQLSSTPFSDVQLLLKMYNSKVVDLRELYKSTLFCKSVL